VALAVTARFELAYARAVVYTFSEVIYPVAVLDLEVGHLGIDGGGHVARERPRGRRPHEERFVFAIDERETHEDRGVLHDPAALGDLHRREAGTAPEAPRHHVVAAVDIALVETLLEEAPDRVVVLGREREIAPAVGGASELAHDRFGRAGRGAPARHRHRDLGRALAHRVAEGEERLRIVPIHPLAEADRLLGLARGEG